ncbi:MAG: amino acid adenylation domain-containing protein [Cyanobacteriota bacterium]|nr:amino acid adenylation domain-containing protein [Cyanobacteriota bacterium]
MDIKNLKDIYRLSPLQEANFTNEKPSCGQLISEVRGVIDLDKLEGAWQQTVDRHSVLRTLFVWKNLERPQQVVVKKLKVTLSKEENLESLENFLEGERQQIVRRDVAPLARLAVGLLSEERHKIVLTYDRLILDKQSSYLLLKEVWENYSDRAPETPEIPEFKDYIAWVKKQDRSEAEAFWSNNLKGVSSSSTTLAFAQHGGTASGEERQQLKIPLKIEIVSSWQILVQGAWALLLSRYNDSQEAVFGMEVTGRPQELPDSELIVGTFENDLPVRVSISPEVSVGDWLQELGSRQAELQQYAYNSPAQIQDWSEIDNFNLSSLVSYAGDRSEELLEPQSESIDVLKLETRENRDCPIALKAKLDRQELTLEITYDRSSFESGAIARLLGHLETLITAMASEPETKLEKLPLLTEGERELLAKWNESKTDEGCDRCIHQLIQAQAEKTPERVAVVFEEEQLTYKELNRRANQLAHYLQGMGVGPDVLVGICVERSLEMLVGILGVLKAGGAYVPIDASYPFERISFILGDAQPPVLLTQEHLEEELPAHWGQIIALDSEWEEIAAESDSNPSSSVSAENLVYVIYTSGSTGKPKGVLVSHKNLVHSTTNRCHYYPEPPGSFLLLSSFAFDSSVAGIFWTLCEGGKLVLPSPQFQTEPERLARAIAEHQVEYLLSIPSLYGVVLEQASPEQLSALRGAIVAGEAYGGKLIERHRQLLPRCGLFNEYGPTEGTVWSTVYNCQDWQQEASVPIGRAIANTQIHILDRHQRPVPIGIKGELYIGGAGIARGYLNRPELTEEKFIGDPFSDRPDARLYKTGDLGRYREDGNIEFLGRMDDQVKIRGYRIELGEIEAILGGHPGVAQCAVIARSEGDRQFLVGYIVPSAEEEAPNASALRDFLKSKLPEYMVPASIVNLSAMPLTPNGKLDRRALPAPQDVTSSSETGFVAPRTPQEKCLAEIWSELLSLKQVSIHDNFFELGGDSIISIQAIARANRAGLVLNPKQLFEHQTIAKLAAVAGATQGSVAEQGLVTGAMPLTPIQHWFWEQNLPEPHHFNQSLLLEVSPELKPEYLQKALEQLLLHHDALRLRASGWPPEQAIAPAEETVPLAVADLSDLEGQKQPQAMAEAAAEVQASLNLAEGPIMRAVLFKLGTRGSDVASATLRVREACRTAYRLLLVIHHLAVDGISWRILLEDIASAYEQAAREETIQLPPKTTSFRDWAERLIEYAGSEALEGELDYWQERSRREVATMPVDLPESKGNNTVASSKTVTVSLNAEQTRLLLQEVPSAYNTQINEVLLTALAQSWATRTGDRRLLVELEGHGREQLWDDVDLSRTVGWFTTRFPVCLELEATANQPGEALKSIKEQLRQIPAKGIGYGILRYLSQDATLKSHRQPEVSFNYLGQFDLTQSESIFRGLASEETGPTQSPSGQRRYLLELNGLVVEGKLQLDWTYSENIHKQSTIEQLARGFIEALNSIIDHCVASETGSYTPSDFPDVALDQSELDDLVAEINW